MRFNLRFVKPLLWISSEAIAKNGSGQCTCPVEMR